MTRRSYPTMSDADGIGLYAEGGTCEFESVDVWQLLPAPVKPYIEEDMV